MAELKPFEVIMLISPIAGQNGKGEVVMRAEKVAELVRCKNCKRYTPFRNIQGGEMGEGECEGYDPCVPADHYCSRGERKESEDNIETLEAWNLDGSPTRYIKGQKDEQNDYHIENDGTYEGGD